MRPNTFRAFEETVLRGRTPNAVADDLGMTQTSLSSSAIAAPL